LTRATAAPPHALPCVESFADQSQSLAQLQDQVDGGLREPPRALRRYCTLLGEAGVALTEDDAWQQYWLFAVYSWVAVTSTAGMAFGGTARLTGEDCRFRSVTS